MKRLIAAAAAFVSLAAGCSFPHSHPALEHCHAHAAMPGHAVHDHQDGGLVEYPLTGPDGGRGVGVSAPCEEGP